MKKEIIYKLLIAIAIVAVSIALQYLMEASGFIRYYWTLFGLDYSAVLKIYYGNHIRVVLASILMGFTLCIGTNFIYKGICERN